MQLVLNRFNFFFNVSTFLPFPLKPSTHHVRSRDRDVRVRMEWWGILVLFALTAILLKAASSLTSNVVMQRGRPASTKFAREAYWSLAKGSKSYHELLAALQSHAARHIRLNFRNATHDSLIQSLSSDAVISAFYRSTKIIIIIIAQFIWIFYFIQNWYTCY